MRVYMLDEHPDKTCYIDKYGKHFNEKLCNFATSLMKTKSSDGKTISLSVLSKEQVDNILNTYKVTLTNNHLWDYVYVANMCKADFLGSSIKDDLHMALYIKDVIDDVDASECTIFNRWWSDIKHSDTEVDWEAMI